MALTMADVVRTCVKDWRWLEPGLVACGTCIKCGAANCEIHFDDPGEVRAECNRCRRYNFVAATVGARTLAASPTL